MQEHFEEPVNVRKYGEFFYCCREWSKERRHLVRCEYTTEGPDLMFVITNATGSYPRRLYEERYCRRARCENWIKDLKTYLKCDRTSCQEATANQFRLLLHTFAYVLLWHIRVTAKLPAATVPTIQMLLLKIGVIVKETGQKLTMMLTAHCPGRIQFERAWFT
jgi:hypothetical protein